MPVCPPSHAPARVNMVDADEIAKLCYERFQQLPRRGKPEPGREWTLLAAVLRITRRANSDTVEKEVVSLGTGTKCIGQTAMSPSGEILNDSHAEVIARRGCAEEQGKWRLHPGVSFLFFTSHTPCGDAAIIAMNGSQSQPCPPITPAHSPEEERGRGDLKRKDEESSEVKSIKRPRQEEPETAETHLEDRGESRQSFLSKSCEDPPQPAEEPVERRSPPDSPGLCPQVADVHRTGAKCVSGGPADPLLPGEGYHWTGLLRVKPGRGEPTLSLSCSDKLARWGVLGFQGALLSLYLQEALYYSTVVVGGGPYSQQAMTRALVTRCSCVSTLPAGFSVRPPQLLQSSLEFPFSQAQTELHHQAGQGRISPCGASISWCNVPEQPLDVTANGYKHGVTRKALGTAKARDYKPIIIQKNNLSLSLSRGAELLTYWDYKQAAQSYQQAWQQLLSQAFPLWPRTDRGLLLFH
ncbi:tRNA-specific adenosine deaminase 1 [Dissostichus eleginoides]|uniref:tRNA-specific adenosine deaminase 1 n=1 Tax=Dissostichus eleginoides TaxID=100907 RepID=A0AAD9B078_DISEL|nr:tRNA-specific adenosine deaminase 1 [Dissostichus eleginoides]